MPTKTFYLDDARTEPLTAEWGLFYRNFTVRYAGIPLAPTNPEATIAQGRQYHLPNGRVFSAQLKQNTYPQELELLIDSQPVPGNSTAVRVCPPVTTIVGASVSPSVAGSDATAGVPAC